MFDSCNSRNNSSMSANTTHQSTSKSSTLASIKSSLIAKVNHAAIRRQLSAVDPCISDITAATQRDGLVGDVMSEVAAGRRAEGRASVPGVHRRRIRSPFSSSRILSEPNKPQRSSLAEQRIIESVVFRPTATTSSGRSAAAHQIRDTGDGQAVQGCRRRSVDIAAGVDDSHDVVIDRQGVVGFKRSLSHGQGCDQAGQSASSTTLVRSVSTDNNREQLLPFVNGNFNELP